MIRDFQRLKTGPFDLLVIGGGIYGAWIAYDAALRGLRVALVERFDWGAGTSSASSKLIHGGLRYLEQANFRLVRKSLQERKLLVRLAPHRVQPLRFVVPVYAGDRLGRWRLKVGLTIYDLLAGRHQPVRHHEMLSRRELLMRHSFLLRGGLKGGFTYGDCQTDDARFTLEIVDGALRAGAAAVNYARALDLSLDGSRVAGARIQDVETGETIDVEASLTVNCAGPAAERLSKTAAPGAESRTRMSKGIHLVMPPLPGGEALLLTSHDGRVVFLIPWYGKTLLGTTDTDFLGDPDEVRVEPEDVAYLLAQANRVMTGSPWNESDVVGSFAGLRVLPATRHRSPSAVSRDWLVDETAKSLLTCSGGKFTSARADSVATVDRIMGMLGRDRATSATGRREFPWAPRERYRSWRRQSLIRGIDLGIDEETAACCLERYGWLVDDLFDLVGELPTLARRIVPDAPFCMAEIFYVAKSEMARTLEDVLRRRIPLLLLSHVPTRMVQWAAAMVGSVHKWSDERKRLEATSIINAQASGPTGARAARTDS